MLKGQDKTVDEVISAIIKDRTIYLNSGGGVTLSGGEPLLQREFALGLLKACKSRNIHTVVQTCGYADQPVVEAISPYVDLFLYDIKTLDNERHISGTGVDNSKIIGNAAWLARSGNMIKLRMALIPGFNDSEQDVKALLSLANELSLRPEDLSLLKYNPLGEVKYTRLGRETELEQLDIRAQSDEYFNYLSSLLRK